MIETTGARLQLTTGAVHPYNDGLGYAQDIGDGEGSEGRPVLRLGSAAEVVGLAEEVHASVGDVLWKLTFEGETGEEATDFVDVGDGERGGGKLGGMGLD